MPAERGNRKARPMSWEEFGSLEERLYESVKKYLMDAGLEKVDAVIGVFRGGLTLARCLVSKLGEIPLIIACMNNEIDFFGEDVFLLDKMVPNKEKMPVFLVVDDISDSGETFTRLTRQIKSGRLITAALVYKTYSSFKPDCFASIDDTRDWIVFPWENPGDSP